MPIYEAKWPHFIQAFRMGQKGEPTPAPAWFGSPEMDKITSEGIIIDGVVDGKTYRQVARWGDYVIRSESVPIVVMPMIFETLYGFSASDHDA